VSKRGDAGRSSENDIEERRGKRKKKAT